MIDVWIAKLDADGEKEWRKGRSGESSDDHVTCIERLSDGHPAALGHIPVRKTVISLTTTPDVAIWNMQSRRAGRTVLWKGCYPGRSGSFAMDGKETPDAGMIMIGQSYSIPGDPAYHGGYDWW